MNGTSGPYAATVSSGGLSPFTGGMSMTPRPAASPCMPDMSCIPAMSCPLIPGMSAMVGIDVGPIECACPQTVEFCTAAAISAPSSGTGPAMIRWPTMPSHGCRSDLSPISAVMVVGFPATASVVRTVMELPATTVAADLSPPPRRIGALDVWGAMLASFGNAVNPVAARTS
ncbi:hypothetical protein ACFYO1_32115 [Nocardia sp. NPDC006044]|uniref:hypothetical protein n=1 Tax=Nocardia sp. NPDC006044 TaxID=3364306 RepID=UPI0036AAF7B1